MKYQSGEEVRAGDNILYHGEAGRVEFVAMADDPETNWYVEQCGGGCMLLVPSFGRVFLNQTDGDEDLEFVCRGSLK